MEFNEEKAIEIVNKYGLDSKTIRVWRTRQAIPDKYSNDDFKPRVQIDKVQIVKHERVFNVLCSSYINRKNFAELIGVPEYKLNDAMPTTEKRVLLSESDLLKCEVEIKKLKIEIAKCFQSFQPILLKRLVKNPVLVYSTIVKERSLIDVVSYVRRDLREPSRDLWLSLKDPYILASMQFTV